MATLFQLTTRHSLQRRPCTMYGSLQHSQHSPEALILHCVKDHDTTTFTQRYCMLQVNAEPHMGSAYTTMAADAIARFQRLLGRRVTLVTGRLYLIASLVYSYTSLASSVKIHHQSQGHGPCMCLGNGASPQSPLRSESCTSLSGHRHAGTDEHGEKIAEAAAAKGQQPQEHCDGVVSAFKGLWEEVMPLQ